MHLNCVCFIQLQTENGRVLLLFQILKSALAQRNTVDILDTLWEIEDVCKEIDEDQVSNCGCVCVRVCVCV